MCWYHGLGRKRRGQLQQEPVVRLNGLGARGLMVLQPHEEVSTRVIPQVPDEIALQGKALHHILENKQQNFWFYQNCIC